MKQIIRNIVNFFKNKSSIQNKQLKVLNETISHYNIGNRGYSGVCQYITGDGRKCAIGRLITDDLASNLEKNYGGKRVNDVFKFLPKDIQELGEDFLEYLQTLHDSRHYWNETGLTDSGKSFVSLIKDKFSLN